MRIAKDAKEHPMTPAQLAAEDRFLNAYRSRKARSHKQLTDDDVVRIIHESRRHAS
jgi:hypothetical protein